MKKISILVVVLICVYSVNLLAQEAVERTAEYPVAFQPGEKIIQGGLGFGMMGVYGDVVIPPISVSIDIAKEIEEFPISFGGIIGLAKSEYDWSYAYSDEYKWTYTYFLLGARAAYHLNLKSPKIDPYGGIMLGYNIVSVKEPDNYPVGYSSKSSYMMYGFYGGARYFFNPKMAVYAELGYGFGYLNLGISYKL